jgi:hypothetical protein
MSKASLIGLGGIAAIVAGILRGVASFIPDINPDPALQLLYFSTDVFILLGIIALYGIQHKQTGKLGLWGFLISTVGILLIRSSKAITGVDLYPAGALIFSLGINILGISLWLADVLSSWVVGLWVLSILAGVIVYFVPSFNLLLVLAGLMFAVGFAAAGIRLWSAANTAGDVL